MRRRLPALLVMTATALSAQDSPAEKLLARKDPLVIAHRGSSAHAPENTLPAFNLAKEAKADLIELDYYHSKDGQPIVFHDKTLDRTTDAVARWGGAKIPVESKTVMELKTLDAGRWFDARFAGTPLPTLAESLDCIQAGSVTLIERKGGDAATCAKLLQSRGEVNKVIVQAFDWKYLADFHALEPKQILGALGPPSTRDGKKLTDEEKMLNAQYIREAKASGARVIGWNNKVTKESVAAAHATGIDVWIYTVNKPEEANALLDKGVDGIITDDPALIRKTIGARK
jgi:glycerophosphoryl diester phosphodiesterase